MYLRMGGGSSGRRTSLVAGVRRSRSRRMACRKGSTLWQESPHEAPRTLRSGISSASWAGSSPTTSERSSWPGFAIATSAVFVLALSVTLPTALYSSYATRYGFGSGALTLIFAAYVAGNLAVLLGLGGLADHVGWRRVLFAAVLTAMAGTVLFILADSVALLLVARFVQGAALGLVFGASTAALVDLHPAHDHDRAALASTVAIVSGQGVGALLGGVFGEWLPEPLRLVWLVYLAALIVVLVLLLLLPNDTRRHEPGWLYPTRLAVPSSMRALFIAYAVGAFAMSAVVGLYSSLTPSFLHTLLGLPSLALAGSVTFVLMLASVLAQIVCRSWNSRKAGVSGLLIVTAGLIVVTAAAAVSSLALLLAGSGIAGAGQGLAFMGLLAGVNGAAPDDQRAEVVSAFYVATWLGAALPVLAVGFAAPGIGLLRAAWIFTAVIAVISLGATAGLLKLKPATVGR